MCAVSSGWVDATRTATMARIADEEHRMSMTDLRDLPSRGFRTGFLWASRRRSLARMATSNPTTARVVRRFVAGETLDEAVLVLARLRSRGLMTTVDVLGEAVTSPAAAEEAAERYVAVLERLASSGLDRNVSLKLTQMGLDLDAGLCRSNVDRIARVATGIDAFVRIDMEDHLRTDTTLEIARQTHAAHPGVGVVLQAYLRRSAADAEVLISEGIPVRLCKGAYDEPASVAFPHKDDVDANYVQIAQRLLTDGRYPALATHDEAIISNLRAFCDRAGVDRASFEFQMLYGVRRDIQERLVADGYRVRVYVPFGTEWYPYYMRRLAERPANVLFMLRSVLRDRGSRRPAQGVSRHAVTVSAEPSAGEAGPPPASLEFDAATSEALVALASVPLGAAEPAADGATIDHIAAGRTV
jgi:proline dehydrogenase